MFYIDHGTVSSDGKVFDAKVYQWISDKDNLSLLKMSTADQEWFRDSCHPNGYFKCNRCYRKHFIVDNFDLLCDGCVNTLKLDFPDSEPTLLLLAWKIDKDTLDNRIFLRDSLDKVYKSEKLYYESKEIEIVKDPMKNNGNLSVRYKDLSLGDKPFNLNVKYITVGS